MKFPQANFLIKTCTLSIFVMFACIFAAAISISAQDKFSAGNPSADLGQCRNGQAGSPVRCIDQPGGSVGWVNGNAGPSNSHYQEDDFIPYRMIFDNLDTGTFQHKVILEYDIFHSQTDGKHAIDYLGSYNFTETDADPCSGTPLMCNYLTPSDTEPVPIDPLVTASINPFTGLPVVQKPGVFTIWGGNIISIVYLPYEGGITRQVEVTFTASVENPVLAWGGHIAFRGDYGFGNTAGDIPGAPYHMRLIDLDGSGGNQDRSLQIDNTTGVVVIVKQVVTGSGSSDTVFNFTSTSILPPVFSLIDNNEGPGSAVIESVPIQGSATLSVTESATAGFTLLGAGCTELGGTQNSTFDATTDTVNIMVEAGEVVTCTFSNGVGGATAGEGSISGRVVRANGRGISRARVTVTNAETGETSTVLTSTFGYYRFEGLEVADLHFVSVVHKRFSFVENMRTFTLNSDVAGLDFVAKQ